MISIYIIDLVCCGVVEFITNNGIYCVESHCPLCYLISVSGTPAGTTSRIFLVLTRNFSYLDTIRSHSSVMSYHVRVLYIVLVYVPESH